MWELIVEYDGGVAYYFGFHPKIEDVYRVIDNLKNLGIPEFKSFNVAWHAMPVTATDCSL